MPVYKEENGTWRARFYYIDHTSKRRETQKRGFKKKSEAQEYEREFLRKAQYNVDMTFESLVVLYFEDLSTRLKENTLETKKYLMELKIAPFFNKLKLSEITPNTIRAWQRKILQYTNEKTGKKYSQTYIKTMNNQLVAIFNYAVRFYNLKENPCHKAGSIGKKNADEMNIWSIEEFKKFISSEKLINPIAKTGFQTLFWTGLRIGELLALTREDIDLEKKTLRVNKSYQRLKGRDIITTPKTPRSNRIIEISDNLANVLENYFEKLYDLKKKDRIFPCTKYLFEHEIKRIAKAENMESIRLHDLRHSHASLLIHLGVNPVLISKRLGHEKVETTLNTYSHIYPNANISMMNLLNDISAKK